MTYRYLGAMKAIELTRIELRGTDAQGRYAMAEVDGEWVGVSLDGEDECVRDLRTLRPGMLVEVGTEQMRVVSRESFKIGDRVVGKAGTLRAGVRGRVTGFLNGDPTHWISIDLERREDEAQFYNPSCWELAPDENR